ncbi:MAG: ribonuclease H-like domain-containing protein [Clostridiales bacterium]|nr:ribonuclease H-like domain-containing protein [Clostridiales bacterium]
MLEIKTPCPISMSSSFQEEHLFFDIETTGLNAKGSILYLIGIGKKENGSWNLIQLFNEDGESEKELILRFFELIPKNATLIHYNGTTFDLPYLKTRCQQLSLSFAPLETLSHEDYYSYFRPFKSLLSLPNGKQHTLEKLTGFQRQDTLSGKKLIEHYFLYLKLQTKQQEHLLLLHNFDDLCGLMSLSSLAHLKERFPLSKEQLEKATITCESSMISYSLPLSTAFSNEQVIRLPFEKEFFPFLLKKRKDAQPILSISPLEEAKTLQEQLSFSVSENTLPMSQKLSLLIQNKEAEFCCPIFKGTLKFFYPNYKDYFFLPLEDTAIHKSVASFVDKDHKKKATADTCYTKKEGVFLPVFGSISSFTEHSIPIFYESYYHKQGWILYDSSFSLPVQRIWVENLLEYFQILRPNKR